MWGAVLVAASVLVPASGAVADDFADYQSARRLYEEGEFVQAVQRFRELVGTTPPRLTDPAFVLESRKLFAAALLRTGHPEEAERQFELLLVQEPAYDLNPYEFPREVVTLFQSVNRRVQAELRRRQQAERDAEQDRLRQQLQDLLRQNERARQLAELAATETVESTASRWLAALPFGVGQFQNGNRGLGIFFASLEAVFAAASIASYIVWRTLDPSNYDTPSETEAEIAFEEDEQAARITNWASIAAFGAAAAAGIAEAQLNFVPAHQTTRRRELPPELQVEEVIGIPEEPAEPAEPQPERPAARPLSLHLSPFGASLTVRF